MLTRNDVHRDLLQKLDELCRKANVKYVLHARAAFLAHDNKPIDEINSFEVLMCQGDAERISNILDDDAYYFEDSRSNIKFDGHYMMFGLKNSLDLKNKDLDFNATRHIENHGIRIIIKYLERPESRIAGKVLRGNTKILKFRNMDADYNFRNYKSKRNLTNKVFKIVNDNRYNRMVNSFKKRSVGIDSWDDIKKYPVVKTAGSRPMNPELFDSIMPIEFDGIPTFILKDFETYATNFYGKDWRDKRWPQVKGCTSTMISWKEISNDPEVKKITEEISRRYDIIHVTYEKTIPDREVYREMKRQVVQSKNVIYTREETIQHKDKIMEAYETGNMAELDAMLNPLIQSLTTGIDRGYTYSVDEEIDEIVDSYLRKNNNSNLANEIKRLRVDV